MKWSPPPILFYPPRAPLPLQNCAPFDDDHDGSWGVCDDDDVVVLVVCRSRGNHPNRHLNNHNHGGVLSDVRGDVGPTSSVNKINNLR